MTCEEGATCVDLTTSAVLDIPLLTALRCGATMTLSLPSPSPAARCPESTCPFIASLPHNMLGGVTAAATLPTTAEHSSKSKAKRTIEAPKPPRLCLVLHKISV
jgi:hypothetical protein